MTQIEEIEKRQEIRIAETEALLKAWKAVTFPTKKDGAPFASMAKNFNGAKYEKWPFAMQEGEYQIKVDTYSEYRGRKEYISDTISVYELVKYLNDEMKAKTENYLPKLPMLEQVYKYDLNDCKKAITQRIEELEKNLAIYKKQAEIMGNAYSTFEHNYTMALRKLATDTLKNEDSCLYSDILDAFKKSYY